MIISLANFKGGVGKSTLAHCLATCPAILGKHGPVGLIDLDPQGTLTTVVRDRGDRALQGLHFAQVLGDKPAVSVRAVASKCKTTILDVPGNQGFASKYAIAVSDLVVVPCRSSLPDEAALAEQLWPYLRSQQQKPRVMVLATMVHAQSNPATHAAYFRALLPDAFEVCSAVFPARSVFENYHRGGLTLWEYADSVRANQRAHAQAQRATADITAIAKEILKHAAT